MGNSFSHFSHEQRCQLKEMLYANASVSAIADKLGVHRSTIYREIKFGNKDGVYNPDCAEERYRENLTHLGKETIITVDSNLAKVISEYILKEHLSPEKIVEILKTRDTEFGKIPKTANTIYRAIDNGLIPNVTRENLNSNTAIVFNNGSLHLAKWVREKLNISDSDILQFEVTDDGKIVFVKKQKK